MPRLPMPMVALAAVAALTAPAVAGVQVGERPDYTFTTVDNKTITPRTFEGRLVVLDFWASWCGPCMAMADEMVRIHQTYHPKGLQIVGISFDRRVDTMMRAASREGFDWPHVCRATAGSGDIGKFGVRGIPHTVLISPDGEVLWRGPPAELETQITAALKTHPPKRPEPADSLDADDADAALYDIQAAFAKAENLDAATTKLAEFDPNALEHGKVFRRARSLVNAVWRIRGAGDERARAINQAFDANDAAAKKLHAITRRVAPEMLKQPDAAATTTDDGPSKRQQKLAARKAKYARVYREAGKLTQAARMCIEVLKQHPRTGAAADADQLLDDCRGDPRATDKLVELIEAYRAEAALAEARAHRAADELAAMRAACRSLVETYPGTKQARAAEAMLDAHPERQPAPAQADPNAGP